MPLDYQSPFPPVAALPTEFKPSDLTRARPEDGYFRITVSDLESCTDIEGDYSIPYSKTFKFSGDTIFCDSLSGNTVWAVRLDHQNPMIRLRPGRTIKRKFSSFTIYSLSGNYTRVNSNLNTAVYESILELYVTVGTLIEDSEPPRDGFGSRTIGQLAAVATATPRLLCADYNEILGFDIRGFWPGRDGGTLLIRNADLGNELRIGQRILQTLGSGFTGIWRLLPGETFTTRLTGSIQHRYPSSSIVTMNAQGIGLVVYTVAGQCLYDWCITNPGSGPAGSIDFGSEMRGLQ